MNYRRKAIGILSTVLGCLCLVLLLVGAALSLQNGQRFVALLCLLMFSAATLALRIVQKRLGINSVTIVAPWLRRKMDKAQNPNQKTD